ncbi:hypothetical protein [Roseomonas sp. KE0001]|uniref:hypothetical protein n=1 Tax=Roseomonas sp. KE0001 TaxID=2479201 RepID=UPI000DB53D19|nr:hypothetical protein [Roseomonas sp. KE0001]PZO66880.1 MAG: hypothetical protein DI636_10565 [Pelagerythrobacter marensis]
MNFRKKLRYAWPANPQGKSVAEVPSGSFCSGCPYHTLNPLKATGEEGYCTLLNVGDWMRGELPLLWDGIKICHIRPLEVGATRAERRYRAASGASHRRGGGWAVLFACNAAWRPRHGRRAGWKNRSPWEW